MLRRLRRGSAPRRVVTAVAVCLTVALGGCGLDIPTDPDGTLQRVSGGQLRVGVSAQPPWTSQLLDVEPDGVEIELVQDFARSLDAQVEWEAGGEEHLVSGLERGELDLVVGGITAKTPWSQKAAVTRPYATVTDAEGKPADHVMLTPLGENAFLVALERFLATADVPL